MNLRDLRYVVAVADTGSFSKAAAQCHVSQPGLSSQVRKLEDYLGVAIFNRRARDVVPTEAGESIIRYARRIISEADALLGYTRTVGQQERVAISIGAFPTLAPYLFPGLVARLVEREPGISLVLVEDKTAVLVQQIYAGHIDVAFLAMPLDLDGLEARSVFSEEFLLCVRRDHALAARAEVSYENLADEELLLLAEGHCLREQALHLCAMRRLHHRRDYSATSLETLRQMVVAGGGVTLIPEMAIDPHATSLTHRRIMPAPPTRTIAVVWHPDHHAASFFEQKLVAEVGALMKEQRRPFVEQLP